VSRVQTKKLKRTEYSIPVNQIAKKKRDYLTMVTTAMLQ